MNPFLPIAAGIAAPIAIIFAADDPRDALMVMVLVFTTLVLIAAVSW